MTLLPSSLRILMMGALSAAAFAQTFTVRVALPDSTSDVADGGTLTLPAAATGQTISANLTVTNRGTAAATINFLQITGSNDFVLASAPEAPFSLTPNGVFGLQINYKATTSTRMLGRFQFNFTVGTQTSNLNLNLVGVAPEFAYSYVPQGGNASNLTGGATIAFPNTAVDATSNAVVVLSNRGTHPGTFNGATVTGAEFATVSVPLANTMVDAGREVRFGVTFTPKQLEAARGQLTVDTSDGRLQFVLEGSGTGARFAYETVDGTAANAVRPNQVLALADTAVGEKSSIVIRGRNTGNADGRITAISVSGAGYNLTEVPLLPLTVTPGQNFALTINFQPTTPGRMLGRLRIGTDDFDLAANALGPTIQYAFVANNITTSVAPNGSVIFTPVAVGATSTLRFTITNTGTSVATVSSIGLAAQSTIFALLNVPGLPMNLQPNASTGFNISFTPSALGTSTATLRVDNQSFTLSGSANAPPALPDLAFDGATGAQQPLQQPAIGLTIARAYPLALTGTLTLAFNSDVFTNDPSVQFATGGRTVTFTIAANTTRAIFPNNQNQLRVQTGSVAGTVTVTPAIGTQDGGINLTPATPPQAVITIAAAAPRILGVALGAKTANTITLLVSGYATARSVTQIDLQFTPTTGENVTTQRLSLPVESAFLGYYQSAQSGQFGTLFTASIPLTLAGDITNVTSVADTLASVSVIVANRLGTSPAVSLQLR